MYLDLLPSDFHCLDHEIYSDGSTLSWWEKALKAEEEKKGLIMQPLIHRSNYMALCKPE